MRKGKLIPRPRGERVTFSCGLIKRATKHVERLQKHLFKAISEGIVISLSSCPIISLAKQQG